MKYQSYIIDQTNEAAAEFFRYAKAVPADKLDWVPGEGSRSVMAMCQEVALCPGWATDIVEGKPIEFDEASMEESTKQMAALTSVEMCEAEFAKKMAGLKAFCDTLPDERLTETKWLPFAGGKDFTMVEMLDYPRWNCNYHTGQVAYIQMMHGDKEMY